MEDIIKKRKNETEEENGQKTKKFVFQIYPENIKYIESLSYQEKQDLINTLIMNYKLYQSKEDQTESVLGNIKKIIMNILIIIIGIPLLLYLFNVSLDLTKSNYLEMQRKFEKLF